MISLFVYFLTFLKVNKYTYQSLYINILCLSVCLSKINVKTAEPIGPKCFMVTHMTPGKLNNLKNCVDIFLNAPIRIEKEKYY